MASAPKPIRYQGKIASWKDTRGFGFIAPNGGGAPVFLHIKAFTAGGRRPVEGDIVTYLLVHDERGKPQAELAAFAQARLAAGIASRSSSGPNRSTTGRAVTVSLVFFILLGVLVLTRRLPGLALLLYTGMSFFTYIAYAVDKSAARNGTWRTSEQALIVLGLAGGWPGALLAQSFLRHKSSKPSFQAAYWGSVVMNCLVLAAVTWTGWHGVVSDLR